MKCQRDIEGESKCSEQCDHCKEYYAPLEESASVNGRIYSRSILEEGIKELARQERFKKYGGLHHPLKRSNDIETLPVTIFEPVIITFQEDQEFYKEYFKKAFLLAFKIPEEMLGTDENNISFRTGSEDDNYGRYSRAINSIL